MVRFIFVATRSGVRCRGFALFEVLISVVVISVGLLAVTTLQTLALRTTQQAHLRNVASEYAIALSERIRSSAGDEIYLRPPGSDLYRLNPHVLCMLDIVGGSDSCPGVSSAVLSIIRADKSGMDAWVRDGLPQASWGLVLLKNQEVLAGPVLTRCDFSLASGSLASMPCSLQLSVSWRALRDDASSTLAYVFR